LGIKRVLITAGPTWVAIDKVRVISNIASGETGILLAEGLAREGAKVTLILGPGESMSFPAPAFAGVTGESMYLDSRFRGNDKNRIQNSKVKIIRFSFFEELRQALKKELKASRYDLIIHSAAVSDFKPAESKRGKTKSGQDYNLRLTPLPKIADEIRGLAPAAHLVLFKLEFGIPDQELILRARKTLTASRADMIVANRIEPRYKAYILDGKRIYSRAGSKHEMARNLLACLPVRQAALGKKVTL